ncbi:hypothetical protein GCM10020000_24340 [Streptomyces olivoverticillatus]
MICNAEGGILDDLIVYRLADQEFMVVANASNAQVVLDALTERAAGFETDVRDDRENYALIAVQGPASPGILKSVTDADLDGLKYYAGLPGTVAGVSALIARTGYTGEDGFELFVAPGDAEKLWQALTEAGAEAGLVPCGLSCRDTLRLEAGMPLYGHELTTATTPFDAGLGRVVKFDKEGDFVGRAALQAAAERAASAPPRKLVGLIAQGRRVPRAGFAVTAGGARSSARSPRALPPPPSASRLRSPTSTRHTPRRGRKGYAWTFAALMSRTRSSPCRSTSASADHPSSHPSRPVALAPPRVQENLAMSNPPAAALQQGARVAVGRRRERCGDGRDHRVRRELPR